MTKIAILDPNKRRAAGKAQAIQRNVGGHITYVRRGIAAITSRPASNDGHGPEAA